MGDLTVRRGAGIAVVGLVFYVLSIVTQAGSGQPLELYATDGIAAGLALVAVWGLLIGLVMVAWGLIRD